MILANLDLKNSETGRTMYHQIGKGMENNLFSI
jgi:hypothetical protein